MPHLNRHRTLILSVSACALLSALVIVLQPFATVQPAWGQTGGAGGEVPVGAIVPFAGSLASLPSNWVPCDGRTVNDPGSPLDGTQVPDLTDNRFLMGVGADTSAGVTGGSNVIPTDGSHGHSGSTSDRVDQKTGSPRYLDTSGNKGFRHTHPLTIRAGGRHNHGGDNRPSFYAVRFIIRVR